MKIALSSDHTGFEVLHGLKDYIISLGHDCVDFGPASYDANDDYPAFIMPAAQAVADRECDAAIILGGSAQGEAMAANRIKGARATVFYSLAKPKQAVDISGATSEDPYEILKLSRAHNHANILSLAARFLSFDEMCNAIKIWLDTPYSNEERHNRRVVELDE